MHEALLMSSLSFWPTIIYKQIILIIILDLNLSRYLVHRLLNLRLLHSIAVNLADNLFCLFKKLLVSFIFSRRLWMWNLLDG